MENSVRYRSVKQSSRSGYEPSDTETEGLAEVHSRRQLPSSAPRRHSKSPYRLRDDDGNDDVLDPPELVSNGNDDVLDPPELVSNLYKHRNVSPLSRSNHSRHVSRLANDYESSLNRKQSHRKDVSRTSERSSNYSRRYASAPRPRLNEKELLSSKFDDSVRKGTRRTQSPLPRREVSHRNVPSVGEINEVLGNVKISRNPVARNPMFESTESIEVGDIFFSRDYVAFAVQSNGVIPSNGAVEKRFSPKPQVLTDRNLGSHQRNGVNAYPGPSTRVGSSSTVLTQTNTNLSSVVSRQSSNISDTSGRTTDSMRRFTANRRKSQKQAWFSCIKKGYCRTSKKSPEREREIDESSVIGKALVVESLRQFWADKHQPASLDGFICHKQQALLLKQTAANDFFPHILLKGPPGSGKRALTMALLREIYGDPAWNISHELRCFFNQERSTEVVVPVGSSPYHVELNVYTEPNSKHALMNIVKKISAEYAATPEISNVHMKADYKILVLYDVDKATESIQHFIKWIMDCYSDSCKLILCCEDDEEIAEPVKSRCELIKVEPPINHEIMEVLIYIAKKEDIELPTSFAAKIAAKSKQNLRDAIMALEACTAHNYPFAEDQPIPFGWEEALVELAVEIIADPSPKRLFFVRGKFQKLLGEFVHPKLILLKLVELFLKRVDGSLKRELYYWHSYYDKRLPTGTTALLKLEEFVAKFMSIYRKSSSSRQLS